MTTSREFHLGDILTVTTGCLVAPRRMEAMYDLLGFMTGDALFTHQLPRAAEECAPALLEQHPGLREVEVPDAFSDEQHVWRWLAEQVAQHGEILAVTPLAAEDHARIDPLVELRMMAPHTPVIVIDVPGEVSQ